MNCTKCGAENAPESKFCVVCGSPLAEAAADPIPVVEEPAAAVATEAPAEAQEGKVDVNAIKNQLVDTVKPVFAKIKPYLTNKKVLIGIAAVVVLLVVIAVISAVSSGNNGFVQLEQSVLPMSNGGEINLIVDKKVLSDTVEAEGTSDGGTSIDGKVTAFTTSDNELYVLNGKKLKKVAEDVADFEMSVTGAGIAYVTRDEDDTAYTLTLYTVKNGKSTTISDEMSSLNYVLSPDGKSVCYYEENDEDEDVLMFSKGKDSVKITSNETELFGLSNGGKYIYAACESEASEDEESKSYLYSYNTKGEREKLGEISSSYVRFNEDHTQVMFFNEGKTYISTKAKEAVKASSNQLSLVIAPNATSFADSSATTYPVSNLYNHVYTCSDGETTSAWLIKKNSDKNVKLVSKVSSPKLDASAEYLYYIYDGEELRVIKISDGEKATERYVTLADDVSSYVVTSDRDLVYYTSDSGVYSVNGKKGGKSKTVCNDGVESGLTLNAKDVVYYIMDGDLYACSNGKKGSKVISDVSYAFATSNGVVYCGNEDTLYATTGSKKPSKILDLE